MIQVKRKLRFRLERKGRRRIRIGDETSQPAVRGRIPRISRLMALAIRFERLLAEGTVRDQSEMARLSHVTQPRMTQIMNLLYLAPDIQEELLFLPLVMEGKDPITEKILRPISAEVDWGRQRKMWRRV